MIKPSPAVLRAANELAQGGHGTYVARAKRVFAAALRVEEMAPTIDPTIVEPLRSKVMEAWRLADLDAEKYMAEAEARAAERASALRIMILGEESTT